MNWLNCFSCKEKALDDVKTLDYNRTGLTEVPPEVFNFERTLETLYLDGNKITELPRMLFQCEELRYLDVSDNEIQSLPSLISKLVNLQTLNLSRNCLKHVDIPMNIHRCQKLTVLDLSSNTLDKVPEGLTSLVNLEELYLNDTYIEYLPANFGRLCNLKILELRDNNMTALPKSLRRMTQLVRLDLSNNDFADMPEVIGNMTNLKELWVNGNCIGSLNSNIGNLQNLLDFDASKNDIEFLPKEIGRCTKLTSLILSNNLLKELPNVIGKLANLQILKLDYNCLESLPSTIGDLTNLEELDVQNNQITSLPNSIGFLRKLNILIASHNFLSSLPSEIGSCISLTIINLHNNMLKKLPDEIGHLQNLTSLGLIGNKLEFLPIPVTNLPLLRALWLTQNQSHPLIPLQTEKLESTGQLVLTCFLLPQIQITPQETKEPEPPSVVSPKRHICFTESGISKDAPARLMRAPTPYPKELQRFQRSLNNQLRKNRETSPQSININLDPSVSQIKEAKVTPMKNDQIHDTTDGSVSPLYISSDRLQPKLIRSCNGDNQDVQIYDNSDQYCNGPNVMQSENHPLENNYGIGKELTDLGKFRSEVGKFPGELGKYPGEIGKHPTEVGKYSTELGMYSSEAGKYPAELGKFPSEVGMYSSEVGKYPSDLNKYSTGSDLGKYTSELSEKPAQPPPYHIAAAYSKNAKYFNNDYDSSQLDKPKKLSQELGQLGSRLKNPEVDEVFLKELNERLLKSPPDEGSANTDLLGNHLGGLQVNDKEEGYQYKSFETGNNNREQGVRMNEERTSPKLMRVVLTPCCYVLGFSIIYNEHGVFVNKVDENGNAYHKLYPGDKILMLDEQDLTKMHPWQAYKTVLIQGPEAESFFISRL